jgi:hypothetical protein
VGLLGISLILLTRQVFTVLGLTVWLRFVSLHHLKQLAARLRRSETFISTPLPVTARLPRWLGRSRLSIWLSLAAVLAVLKLVVVAVVAAI